MIIGISLAVLVIGLICLLVGLKDGEVDESFVGVGFILILASICFGFILFGNVIPVAQKIERVEKFTIGELGLITNHSSFGLHQMTDFRIIDDLKTDEYDLFIEYDLNSYNNPCGVEASYFVSKKGVVEKDIDISKIDYKVKHRYQ